MEEGGMKLVHISASGGFGDKSFPWTDVYSADADMRLNVQVGDALVHGSKMLGVVFNIPDLDTIMFMGPSGHVGRLENGRLFGQPAFKGRIKYSRRGTSGAAPTIYRQAFRWPTNPRAGFPEGSE